MDQLLTIEILGKPFTFKTDQDMSEAQEMADLVDKSVRQASVQYTNNTHLSHISDDRAILLLAALNIANEYFDLKKKHQQMLCDLSQRSEKLINALEAQDA